MARARATMDPFPPGSPPRGEAARAERRDVARDHLPAVSEADASGTQSRRTAETNRRDERRDVSKKSSFGAFGKKDDDVGLGSRPDAAANASDAPVDGDTDRHTSTLEDTEKKASSRLERRRDESDEDASSDEDMKRRVQNGKRATRVLPESAVAQIKAAYARGLAAPMLPPPRRAGQRLSTGKPVSYTHLTLPTTPYV